MRKARQLRVASSDLVVVSMAFESQGSLPQPIWRIMCKT